MALDATSDIFLTGKAAQPFRMALNELTTNATKWVPWPRRPAVSRSDVLSTFKMERFGSGKSGKNGTGRQSVQFIIKVLGLS